MVSGRRRDYGRVDGECRLLTLSARAHALCDKQAQGRSKADCAKAGVSVTPGVDNATALTLLKKYPSVEALAAFCEEQGFDDVELAGDDRKNCGPCSKRIVQGGVDIYSIDELIETLQKAVEGIK